MVELIAKNTIQRVLDGRFVSHAPGTRFEMLDEDAAQLVRMNAAALVSPSADVTPIQAPVAAPAVLAHETPKPAPEAAHVEPETAPEAEAEPVVAGSAKKTARKAKATE